MKKTAQYVIFRSEIISRAEGRLKNKRVNPPMLCIDHFQLQKSHEADEGVLVTNLLRWTQAVQAHNASSFSFLLKKILKPPDR